MNLFGRDYARDQKRLFVPEVIQTSEMDCGPACLKSLLGGFGISASYGRLREACQTSVDGTSIDTLEELAVQLGLEAEQVMLPFDHLLITEAQALPALVVVRLPSGVTHFIVAWSQHANWVQVMDPGGGRRWLSQQRFVDQLFIHEFPVPAAEWREWAISPDFMHPLRRRMSNLGLVQSRVTELIEKALGTPGWRPMAALDAAVRFITSLVDAGGLVAGEEASGVLERFFLDNAGLQSGTALLPIPPAYWSVSPLPQEEENPVEPYLLLRGAVMIRVKGRRTADAETMAPTGVDAPLSSELTAVLEEPPERPEKEIFRALRQDGLLVPSVLVTALALSALGVTIQALLLQGLLQIGTSLKLLEQRWVAVGALFIFLVALLLLELPLSATAQRIGRRLESRLRIAFLAKIPRLGDRYFHSRLTSDMTQRAHDLRSLRLLPTLGVELLRTGFQLVLTTLGVIWLQPRSAPIAILSTLIFISLSFVTRPLLEERDLRLRSHLGALSRFYLDALVGLVPLRTHGAERAFRREHEGLLVEWVRASFDFARVSLALQALSTLLYSGFAVWILFDFVNGGGPASEVLLLFYWTLNLPVLGQALVEKVQQYPMLRNRVLRMLEPLGAPDEVDAAVLAASDHPLLRESDPAVHIELEDISVRAGGHSILSDVNLELEPGEHLAIVGPSGAGKSSLVGLLLGWHKPATGQCRINGQPLDGEGLRALRRVTAWVDPAVQLWNRSLLENLTYGNETADTSLMGLSVEEAELYQVFERLENGLQTPLGESGGLVSGGEGQRVRLARALNQRQVRLVILDEPFRGLDREKRQRLLKRVRRLWQDATLICITHDVGETRSFDRVLVVEEGRIVEDAAPEKLIAIPHSRYSALLKAEEAVQGGMWQSAQWRRLWIEEGHLSERSIPI